MGKRKKHVEESDLSAPTLYGMQIADGLRPDPLAPAIILPTQPNGEPPPEVIDQYVKAAKLQGCSCDEPDIDIIRSSQGGGVISILHGPKCPLINRLDKEAEGG